MYVRDTWWALKFGAAWKVVKELRQMWEKKRTEYTPELAKSEQEKMQFLWRDFPDVAKELNLANGEQHSAPIQPAQRGAGQTTETLTDRDRTQAAKKMADKQRYPHMTAREISAAVGISLSVVYEHPDLENVPTGTRKRLWTTESVIKLKNSHPPE